MSQSKPLQPSVLTAALMTPDANVPMPNNNTKRGSFVSQLLDLAVGEVAMKGHQLPPVNPDAPPDMTLIRERLRNSVTSSVRAAGNKCDDSRLFSTEVLLICTSSADLYVVAITKRTA